MGLFSGIAAKDALERSLRSRKQCGNGDWPQPRLIDLLYDRALRDTDSGVEDEADEWFESAVAELDHEVPGTVH